MTSVWVLLLGSASYLILAGQFSVDEMVAAALVGAVGLAWHRAVLGAGARRYAFERQALLSIGRAVASLPRVTLTVGRRLASGLLRPVEGRRDERVFASGPRNLPREAGRRAVVVLATSLSPDTYVLRVPLDEDTIVTHAFSDSGSRGDPRWPV